MTETNARPGGAESDAAASNNQILAEAGGSPAASAPPEAGTTLADSAAPGGAVQAAPAGWPADWREQLAGDDRKALDQLKRHGSPADLWKKARSLEQKLSSGEYRRDLPKNATSEQLAEWRRERGIPDTPEGYTIELPDGVVPGEADQPVIDAFTAAVHAKNWDNAKVGKCIVWDTMLGLGSTPPLRGPVLEWAGMIMLFLFGKRGFENIARILKR